jgi:DNA-binding response OmpR family regulator
MSAKILVADESPTIHKIVAMAFEDEGITVEGISRGEHVMEYMVEYQPDIVLADIHLPGIDGYELCRQIKNFSAFGGVRVILLTSDFEDIDQIELEISRADDFISKPFKTEEILKKVKSQLELPEQKKGAPSKKPEIPGEPEKSEVIQKEFKDIVDQLEGSTSDPVQQFFDDEETQPSINEIDLESGTPTERKVEVSQEEKPQDDSKAKEALPEIIVDLSEEALPDGTRPMEVKSNDLNSVFQSVLSSPESGVEVTSKPKPGSKPNLIEETLAFMANQQTDEEFEIIPDSEQVTGEAHQQTRDFTDHTLGDKIIKEHMDQVIDRLPEDAKQGSSHSVLEKTVREVLGEVAPKIIREVIQEEIDAIKKMKEA